MWVVTTEGPRGPKCTKSAGALIGLSAWSEHRGSGEYERRGSAEEYRDSEYEHWGSTRRVGRAWRGVVLILSSMKSTPTRRG